MSRAKLEPQEVIVESTSGYKEFFSTPGKVEFIIKKDEDKKTVTHVITINFERIVGTNIGMAKIDSEKLKILMSSEFSDFKQNLGRGNISEKMDEIKSRQFIKPPFILQDHK